MISRRGLLQLAPGLAGGMFGAAAMAHAASAASQGLEFRIATSSALLGDVNENDARAALRSWADVVSTMVGTRVDYEQNFLATPTQLLECMRKGTVTSVACTTPDYLPLAPYMDNKVVLVEVNGVGYEYVLLVNSASSIRRLADLRGKSLGLFKSATTCLAMNWVETLLNASNLGPSDRFLAAVTANPKLSRTVLPVFFRQSDACLVTRSGFSTMCELNPQLNKALRVLAASPPYIGSLFGFHRDVLPSAELKFKSALENLAKSPTGKQLLALFQTSGFSARDGSVLRSAVELLEESDRIKRRYGRGRG